MAVADSRPAPVHPMQPAGGAGHLRLRRRRPELAFARHCVRLVQYPGPPPGRQRNFFHAALWCFHAAWVL